MAQHRQQLRRWLDKWGKLKISPCKWSILAIATLSLGGCFETTKAPPKTSSSPSEVKLELDNLSFQQVDKQGKPLWKVRAKKGIYTPDKKRAKITGIDGDFYQDGQIVLRVTANTGEVEQEGEKVLLRGDVIAKETRNNLVIVGQQVEWQPKTDLLTIYDRVRANHPQLQVQADRGKYYSRTQRMDLTGKIAAISTEPRLGMQTEHLIWLLKDQTVTSDRSIEIQRYKGKEISARVRANSSKTSLDRKIVDLKGNVQFNGIEPQIQVSGESFSWNLDRELVTADRPLTIFDPQQGVTLQSNTGQLNLQANTATLTGNARGVATRNQAKLYADKLTWQMLSQQLIGTGNIIYQQSQPSIKFTGTRSVGKLQDQSIVVTSDRQRQVQTEIIPK